MPEAKRLFLLRHAKSSWDDPQLADRDRPLAPRGRKAAESMAEHLRREEIRPSLVLCSSALRTRQTLDLVAPGGEVRIEDELYGVIEDELVERLQRVAADVASTMVIGHNPALQRLALTLASSGAELGRIERKFPTGALATLTFAGDWRALRPRCAELVAFVRPKELGSRRSAGYGAKTPGTR
jgi:phosphohistidine phosphatase